MERQAKCHAAPCEEFPKIILERGIDRRPPGEKNVPKSQAHQSNYGASAEKASSANFRDRLNLRARAWGAFRVT